MEQPRYLRQGELRSEDGPGLSPYAKGFLVVLIVLLFVLLSTLLCFRKKVCHAIGRDEDTDTDHSVNGDHHDEEADISSSKKGQTKSETRDAAFVQKTMARASSFVKQCLGNRQSSWASNQTSCGSQTHASIDANVLDHWIITETAIEEIINETTDQEQSSSPCQESTVPIHQPSPDAQRRIQEDIEALQAEQEWQEGEYDEPNELQQLYNGFECFINEMQDMFTPEEPPPEPKKLVLPPPPMDDSPVPAFETSLIPEHLLGSVVHEERQKQQIVDDDDDDDDDGPMPTKPDPDAPHVENEDNYREETEEEIENVEEKRPAERMFVQDAAFFDQLEPDQSFGAERVDDDSEDAFVDLKDPENLFQSDSVGESRDEFISTKDIEESTEPHGVKRKRSL